MKTRNSPSRIPLISTSHKFSGKPTEAIEKTKVKPLDASQTEIRVVTTTNRMKINRYLRFFILSISPEAHSFLLLRKP
jgi:hypothetical protein